MTRDLVNDAQKTTHNENAQVVIRLLNSQSNQDLAQGCRFWVGLTCSGHQTPQELLAMDDPLAIMQSAHQQGVNDAGPLMLSASDAENPWIIYLLPPPPKNATQQAAWFSEFAKTINTWNPKQIGIYAAQNEVSPEQDQQVAINPEKLHQESLLAKMISYIRKTGSINDFLVVIGDQGYSKILNRVMAIKSLIESPTVDVTIYH